MLHTNRQIPGIVLLTAMAAGCTGSGDQYPSLAVRDVERVQGQYEPAAPIEPVALPIRSLAPSQSVSALVDQANAAHQSFTEREPAARQLVTQAQGTGRDSDARGRATIALADLSSIRSETEIALAELDLLIAENSNRFEDTSEADAGHAVVLGIVSQQDRALQSLWRALGQ